MRQDKLTKQVIDRRVGGTITYKMERGTAGDLLLVIAGGSWTLADRVSIKLRHSEGVDVVVDRVPALLLATLCDMKRGRPNSGTFLGLQEEGDEENGQVLITPTAYAVNAFRITMGHITLVDANSELEITVELAKAFGQLVTVKLANIEPKSGPDYVLQYEMSNDLESTHLLVREAYLVGRGGEPFFTGGFGLSTVGKDIDVMIYTNGGAYETDVDLLGANTSIDSELGYPVSSMLQLYTDFEALPSPSVRFKITGSASPMAQLFFVKEKMIQKLTSNSSIAQVAKVLEKTEQIEKMDPAVAQAYRHAGAARPSADVKQIKDQLEAITPQ